MSEERQIENYEDPVKIPLELIDDHQEPRPVVRPAWLREADRRDRDMVDALESGEELPRTALPPILQAAPVRHASARVSWADLWQLDPEADDWLVAPFLARGRGHALYAPAKKGKSLLALYVCACAATGRPVLDHPGGDPVRVLYLDLEMTREDVRERLVDMGFGPDDDLEPLAYYSLPALAVLDSQLGGDEVVELAKAHRADVVVVDTMSRVIGGEENSADTMRAFFRWTGGPLKAAGIATLRIDHAGKDLDRGMRGSSAKADDVDLVWQLIPRDRDRLDLKATHRRMGWAPEVVHLEQAASPLGYRITTDSWPAGTAETAEALDRVGVPLDHGKTKAGRALRDAGESVRNETLLAALRYRRWRDQGHPEDQS